MGVAFAVTHFVREATGAFCVGQVATHNVVQTHLSSLGFIFLHKNIIDAIASEIGFFRIYSVLDPSCFLYPVIQKNLPAFCHELQGLSFL